MPDFDQRIGLVSGRVAGNSSVFVIILTSR